MNSALFSTIYYSFQHSTGRLLPNAWPSPTMVKRSTFLQSALSKPWHSYVSSIFILSPMHGVGISFGFIMLTTFTGRLLLQCYGYTDTTEVFDNHSKTGQDGDDDISILMIEHDKYCLSILAVWPLSFIAGLTFIGINGAGFQNRMLLPALPATALLASSAINAEPRFGALASVLLCLSAFLSAYYGLLYAPLYADTDSSVWDILQSILGSPYYPPPTKDHFDVVLKYMRHFGLNKNAA